MPQRSASILTKELCITELCGWSLGTAKKGLSWLYPKDWHQLKDCWNLTLLVDSTKAVMYQVVPGGAGGTITNVTPIKQKLTRETRPLVGAGVLGVVLWLLLWPHGVTTLPRCARLSCWRLSCWILTRKATSSATRQDLLSSKWPSSMYCRLPSGIEFNEFTNVLGLYICTVFFGNKTAACTPILQFSCGCTAYISKRRIAWF